jgi:hypothetical protein
MYEISTGGILMGIMSALLILTATTTNSVLANPPIPSHLDATSSYFYIRSGQY